MPDQTQATDHAFLTVRELADLLRIKERKVYDLAASGAVPCSRATGKLLFPTEEIHAWIASAKSGGTPRAETGPRPAIFLGSHDPLLDWALRQSRCGLATYFDGSLDGLQRFRDGEGIATGLHLHDGATGEWNVPQVAEACAGQNAVLVPWARRTRGLIAGRDTGAIDSLTDLAGRRMVSRQPESGTDRLFHALLSKAGIAAEEITFTETARSEHDAAQAVAEGRADAAFGLEALAQPFGLDFVPVIEERFDLLVDRKAWFDPPMRTLMAFCDGEAFRARAAGLAGYRIERPDEVRWNA